MTTPSNPYEENYQRRLREEDEAATTEPMPSNPYEARYQQSLQAEGSRFIGDPRRQRAQTAIARAGYAPPETGIPEFMPGVTPKPRPTPEEHRIPLFAMPGPASSALAAPFDVFSETAAELGAQTPKVFRGRFGEVEAPTALTEGLGESLRQFRERGLLTQLGLGLIDPFSVAGAGVGAFRVARGTARIARGFIRPQIARAGADISEPLGAAPGGAPGRGAAKASYDELQDAIDRLEDGLEASGVDVTHLIHPSDPGYEILRGASPPWSNMPDELNDLYLRRNAIGAAEQAADVSNALLSITPASLAGPGFPVKRETIERFLQQSVAYRDFEQTMGRSGQLDPRRLHEVRRDLYEAILHDAPLKYRFLQNYSFLDALEEVRRGPNYTWGQSPRKVIEQADNILKDLLQPPSGAPAGVRAAGDIALPAAPDFGSLPEAPREAVAGPEAFRATAGAGTPPAPPSGLSVATAGVPPPGAALPPPAGVTPMPSPVGPRRALPIEPFEAPANRLLGLDTPTERGLRKIPLLRQMYGGIDPAAIHQAEPVARLGITKQIFRETHHAEAKALSMEWMAEAQQTLGFDSVGRARLVKPIAGAPRGPLFRTIFDLVEHPERYVLTGEQSGTIKRAQDIMGSVLRAEQAAGVEVDEVANYWYRNVLGAKDDKLLARLLRKAGTGGSKGHTRSRFYEFAEETVASGKKLDLNPLSSLTRRLEAGINAIADKEISKRVVGLPGMETPLQRADQGILATATSARRNRQVAQAAVLAVQRAKRGEQLPVSTIRAIERILPQIGGQLKPASRITLNDLIQAGAQAGAMPRPGRSPVTILREPHMDALNDLLEQVRTLVRPAQQQERVAVSARAREMARAGQPRYGEAAFQGKLAPQELVQEIDKWVEVPGFGRQPTRTGLGPEALRLWRSTLVSFDLSAGYIQGQSLFFRNNVAWWKAQAASITSLVNQPFSYVSKHYDTVSEGIRNGAIVPPTEMLFAQQGLSSLPTRIPVVGPLFTRTNRAFEWFTFVGQHQLYLAARGNVAAEAELVSLGSAIRKIVGTESYAILGVSRRQQALEAYLAFAPRFYRAVYGTVAQAFTPGPGGDAARKVIGSMIAGATAITIGANYVTQKKMPNFDDVESATWGKFKIGDSYASAYGPFHSFFRTLARVGLYTSQGESGRAATEITRFFKSKASLPVRAAETAARVAITGSARTFEGERIDKTPTGILNFLQEQTPIGPSQITQGALEGRPEEALGIVGLNVNEATREQAKEYELAKILPPVGTNIRVLRTAYYQAGEGLLSDAGRKAWAAYERLPASERKILLRTFSSELQRELKRTEDYRTERRKTLRRSFPTLDIMLVEENWNARPQRSYTPQTPEGKKRQAELQRKKFGVGGSEFVPGRTIPRIFTPGMR